MQYQPHMNFIKWQKNSNLDIDSYIGKKEVISENILSISDLVGKLQNYVGADGKFTPNYKKHKSIFGYSKS